MKVIDVKSNSYIDCALENNEKDHKFKIRDNVRVSKNQNIFARSNCILPSTHVINGF